MCPRRSFFTLAPTLFISISISILAFNGSIASGSVAPEPGLQAAGSFAKDWTYSLPKLPTCQVGDGINVLLNNSPKQVVIKSIAAVIPSWVKATARYKLISFKAGSTTGELTTSFKLVDLKNGTSLGNVIGAAIKPVSSTNRWYVIAADISIHSDVQKHWMIRGLKIAYSVSGKTYTKTFVSSIVLPPTTNCH